MIQAFAAAIRIFEVAAVQVAPWQRHAKIAKLPKPERVDFNGVHIVSQTVSLSCRILASIG